MPCRFSEGMVRVSPETIALAILLVGVIALVGKYIRVRVRLVQKLFLPVSIIGDRKSTRLNSSHVASSYAVFCLKKKMNMRSHSASMEQMPSTGYDKKERL